MMSSFHANINMPQFFIHYLVIIIFYLFCQNYHYKSPILYMGVKSPIHCVGMHVNDEEWLLRDLP